MGSVIGVLVMEDFVMAGWERQSELRHVNRVDVQPCGTRQCVFCLYLTFLSGEHAKLDLFYDVDLIYDVAYDCQ